MPVADLPVPGVVLQARRTGPGAGSQDEHRYVILKRNRIVTIGHHSFVVIISGPRTSGVFPSTREQAIRRVTINDETSC